MDMCRICAHDLTLQERHQEAEWLYYELKIDNRNPDITREQIIEAIDDVSTDCRACATTDSLFARVVEYVLLCKDRDVSDCRCLRRRFHTLSKPLAGVAQHSQLFQLQSYMTLY
jgi:hypothetical protein